MLLHLFTGKNETRVDLTDNTQLRLCLSAVSLALDLDLQRGPAAALTHDLLIETALGQIPALVREAGDKETTARVCEAFEAWSATETPALHRRLERHGWPSPSTAGSTSTSTLAAQYDRHGHGGGLLAGDDLVVIDSLIVEAPVAAGELGRACRRWQDALPDNMETLRVAIEEGSPAPDMALRQRDVGFVLAAVAWDEECRELNQGIQPGLAAARAVVAPMARSDEPVVGAPDDLLIEALVGFISQEARAVHLPGVGVFLSRSALDEAATKSRSRVLDRTLVHEVLHTIQPEGDGVEVLDDADWAVEGLLTEAITERLTLDLGSSPPAGWHPDPSPRNYYRQALVVIDEIMNRLGATSGLLAELAALPDGRRHIALAERMYGRRPHARRRFAALVGELSGLRRGELSSHQTQRPLHTRARRDPDLLP